ncbi:hypothetical protein Y032_0274g1006 [Ancylostoma ceylanicum]|nr:hypothetical protein Y032_0274g1006 [Ancylostoma ceylanicum]
MQLLVIFLFYSSVLVSQNYAGTTCTVTKIIHLKQDPEKCSALDLNTYLDDDLATDPNLFDFIKNIGVYDTFLLRGSNLRSLTNLDVIKLRDGSQVIITENKDLRKIPKFDWKAGDKVLFTVAENHNLDTTELLKAIKAKKVKGARVQRPFACGDRRRKSEHCRIIEGILVLEDPRNLNLPKLEEVYGRVILSGSNLEKLPHMPKLKKIEWMDNKKLPAITIENNPNLKSIAELANIENIVLGRGRMNVVIRNNPKLCIEPENMQKSFVKKYAAHVRECGSHPSLRRSNFKQAAFHDTPGPLNSDTNQNNIFTTKQMRSRKPVIITTLEFQAISIKHRAVSSTSSSPGKSGKGVRRSVDVYNYRCTTFTLCHANLTRTHRW